jgi:hypothetical protein
MDCPSFFLTLAFQIFKSSFKKKKKKKKRAISPFSFLFFGTGA